MNDIVSLLTPLSVHTPRFVTYTEKGWHLDALIVTERIIDATRVLADAGYTLETITGVDWPEQGNIELVYDLFHSDRRERAVLRVRIGRDGAEAKSISSLFSGAAWHEREAHDFFGVRFEGLADHTPLLLAEDADYHPLRKDYGAQANDVHQT
ncbi:MAG: NADH-quinone oxidoreductase subunit C [Spirochaetota bacterium]